VAVRRENGRVALQLRENPFYVGVRRPDQRSRHRSRAMAGRQVDDVRKVGGRTAVIGNVEGTLPE
jgi:hypothetical protein